MPVLTSLINTSSLGMRPRHTTLSTALNKKGLQGSETRSQGSLQENANRHLEEVWMPIRCSTGNPQT
jgi:hypothetical protein